MKKILLVVGLIIVALLVWFGFFYNKAAAPITGKPLPSATYVNASADTIVVDLPFPGAVTGKSFTATGKAKGWYFEGSFPVKVLDQNGKVLAQVPAQAQGDWMTAEFVPFKADIQVPDLGSYMGPATIVFEKDNPSGLPQNDASVSFPITIEY